MDVDDSRPSIFFFKGKLHVVGDVVSFDDCKRGVNLDVEIHYINVACADGGKHARHLHRG